MNKKSVSQRSKRKSTSIQASSLKLVHPDAAGIDLGSEWHYCAVPQGRDEQTVRRFSCLTPDLHAMAHWLKGCQIKTVALESTGVYWVPVVQVLEHHGLEVYLVDARQVRNVSGRKTDVQDCQWLQQLHSYGLLGAAFRPTAQMEPLRNFWRHRGNLVEDCSRQIHLMQKSLEQMNIQLHKVLSDITGVSGMTILQAIVDGNRDPKNLASLAHPSCKRTPEEFVKALTGYYRQDHLFTLQQSLAHYRYLQEQIAQTDQAMKAYWGTLESRATQEEFQALPDRKKRNNNRRKNQPHFDLRAELYTMTGVDLTQIDGLDANTVMTIVSEQGYDMERFPSEKHFCSHLGLCPNNKITGGRTRSRRTRRVQSRAAKALRLAAQSLWKSKSTMGEYFRRMRSIHGAPKAITATAHRLAITVYRALKHGMDYITEGYQRQQQAMSQISLKKLLKRATAMGYDLLERETGEVLS